MRCDQFMGLNGAASQLIAGCGQPHFSGKYETRLAFTGRHEFDATLVQIEVPVMESCVRCEPSGESYCGMFENEYPLHKYTTHEGRVYYERVQADPWSSGPVFFLALQDENGGWIPETLWPDEDIERA